MGEFLARADAFAVSTESTTMIAEAVSMGRPVYLIGPPPAEPDARHERLVDQLVTEGQARRLAPDETPAAPLGGDWFTPLPKHPVDVLTEALAEVVRQ